jgi:hypothetical protein
MRRTLATLIPSREATSARVICVRDAVFAVRVTEKPPETRCKSLIEGLEEIVRRWCGKWS